MSSFSVFSGDRCIRLVFLRGDDDAGCSSSDIFFLVSGIGGGCMVDLSAEAAAVASVIMIHLPAALFLNFSIGGSWFWLMAKKCTSL